MTAEVKRYPEYRIYKPFKSNTGAAVKFQIKLLTEKKAGYTAREPQLFLVGAPQGPNVGENASFFWEDQAKAVTMKLGMPDVGEMLLVLGIKKEYVGPVMGEGRKVEMGLYHNNPRGNTILRLKAAKNGKTGARVFYLSVSAQRDKVAAVQVKLTLTHAEGEVLRLLLERFIHLSHDMM